MLALGNQRTTSLRSWELYFPNPPGDLFLQELIGSPLITSSITRRGTECGVLTYIIDDNMIMVHDLSSLIRGPLWIPSGDLRLPYVYGRGIFIFFNPPGDLFLQELTGSPLITSSITRRQ